MQKTTVHMDYETYSEVDLKKVGAYIYASHPSTEVICLYYALGDDDPVQWLPGDPVPDFVTNPHNYELHAWNSFFEYVIATLVLGWGSLSDLAMWHDTMALARASSLPASLEMCGTALRMSADKAKSKRGKRLISLLSKLQNKTVKGVRTQYRNELLPSVTRDDYPTGKAGDKAYLKQLQINDMYQEFYDYCAQDVVAERAITKKLRPLSDYERQVWLLDQKINLRGAPVNIELIHAAQYLRDEAFAPYKDEVSGLTFGALETTNQLTELKKYLALRGFEFESLAKDKMHEALAREDLPADVRRLLEIRQETGKSSLAKFEALEKYTHTDGRVRNLFMYCGADTGRWAGRGPQPQNLPRPTIGDPRDEDQQAELIQALCDVLTRRDLELVDMCFDSVGDALASCVRSMFEAGPDKILRAIDFSSIEARVLAWLAGQEDLLQVFRDGTDVYKHAASGIYGVPAEQVDKAQRQIGKVCILACFGPDTEVLTDSGWKKIVDIRQDDLVHDGVEFVRHQGVVSRGIRLTTTFAGVTVTPDHKFYIGDGQWRTTDDLNANTRYRDEALSTAISLLERYGTDQTPVVLPPSPTSYAQGRHPRKSSNNRETEVFDVMYAGPRHRFVIKTDAGPVIAHNCGYQGAVGAFQSMAANYFVQVPDEQAKKIVKDWRKANRKIVEFWYAVGEAALMAVKNPGEVYRVRGLYFKKTGNFLYIKLPSGRKLSYYRPHIQDGQFGDQLCYWGMKTTATGGSAWMQVTTYGGKMVENITQAVARDLLVGAMLRLDGAGYDIVLHVHDEVVTEDKLGFGSMAEIEDIVLDCEDWAVDIPMGAEGIETKRYRK